MREGGSQRAFRESGELLISKLQCMTMNTNEELVNGEEEKSLNRDLTTSQY